MSLDLGKINDLITATEEELRLLRILRDLWEGGKGTKAIALYDFVTSDASVNAYLNRFDIIQGSTDHQTELMESSGREFGGYLRKFLRQ